MSDKPLILSSFRIHTDPLWFWEITDRAEEGVDIRYVEPGLQRAPDIDRTVHVGGSNDEIRAIAQTLLRIADEREARGER